MSCPPEGDVAESTTNKQKERYHCPPHISGVRLRTKGNNKQTEGHQIKKNTLQAAAAVRRTSTIDRFYKVKKRARQAHILSIHKYECRA